MFNGVIKNVVPGQKLFKRSMKSSDGLSETSSVSHTDDLDRAEQRPKSAGTQNPEQPDENVLVAPKAAEDPPKEAAPILDHNSAKSDEQESLR